MNRRYISILIGCLIGIAIDRFYYVVIENVSVDHKYKPFGRKLNLDIIGKLPSTSSIEKLAIINDLGKLYTNNEKAKTIAKQVKLLCWVLTTPSALQTKATAIRSTWGKRCNILIFMSSIEDKILPAIRVDGNEGRDNVWSKTRSAWLYIYKHYYQSYSWFLKVDDDTFAIPENVRYFLHAYNPNRPYYFGRHFTPHGGYNSGGSGYIFSKETLRLFLIISEDKLNCPLKAKDEDIQIAKCLAFLDIHPSETRDASGHEMFHPYAPVFHLLPGLIKDSDWLHQYSKWEVKTGPACCSKYSVSFHYIEFYDMYVMDYLIYGLQAYGLPE